MSELLNNNMVDDKILLNMMRGIMGDVLKENSNDFVRRKKMYVTEGAHENEDGRNVITVQEPFGEEFDIPYAPSLYAVAPGDSVWVEWVYGFGNACAVNSGAWQASDLPTCVIPTEDGLIMQVNYQPVMVVSQTGISMDADTVAVSGHIQGDVVNTTEGKNATVNGKIMDVINSLGKCLLGDVNVTVPGGTYIEDVVIEGFHGGGTLRLIFDAEATVSGDWTIRGNKSVKIEGSTEEIGGVNVSSTFIGALEDAVLDIANTDYIDIRGVNIHGVDRAVGDSGQNYGIRISEGTYANLYSCQIDRTQVAVYVEHAHLDIRNCRGGAYSTDETTVANLTEGIVISEDGGNVNARGTIPAGPDSTGTGYDANGYSFVCSGSVAQAVSSAGAPGPVTEVTATWTSSGGYYCSSYKTGQYDGYQSRGTGWKGNGAQNLRMGYNTSDQKYMAGLWIFADADTIATTLAGATITKATVSLTRTGANGSSSGTVVKPYWHGLTSSTIGNYAAQCDPWGISGSSSDTYLSCGSEAQYVDFGETATFELPSAMYAKLQDGSVKGFAIGMNHPTQFFQFLKEGCVLTVTYEA